MGGRYFEEEFGQALFFVSPTPHYVPRETKIEPDRRLRLTGPSSELLAFSVIVAVLVARSGLPVGSPPYILAYPGIAPVGESGTTWGLYDGARG